MFGIFAHPLVHTSFRHLAANTLPFFFLSWCLFYFYRGIAPYILYAIWIGCGILTFAIGKPGWHVGASGIIYGLAFFLFFSGLLRKHVPLVPYPCSSPSCTAGWCGTCSRNSPSPTTSWEGHLSGAIAGTLCAFAFKGQGPQRRDPFEEEEPTEEEGEGEDEAEEAQQEAGTADGTGNDAGENPPPATQRSDAGQTAK